MKATLELYGQFLLSSQINYTCTYLADHFEPLTHDNVQYFLKTTHFTPRHIWQKVKNEIVLSRNGYIIFDDTVLDKSYSHKIELVRRQYSGNTHGLVKGIGVVNCVYYNPDICQYWLIDYRIFAPEHDGKTKLDHVKDMLKSIQTRNIDYLYLLMDSWYATNELFKYAIGEQKIFYCPIKSNRKVDDSGGKEPYKQVFDTAFTNDEVKHGKLVKVFKMPMDTYFKLFRVLVSTTRTDYIVTNDIAQNSTDAAENQCSIRWNVEQLHREEKQLTGIQNCQCRLQRSQRNHIAIASMVWLSLKKTAYKSQKTVYNLKNSLLDSYMTQQLVSATIPFA
jgi:DDE superfamily endonuclease